MNIEQYIYGMNDDGEAIIVYTIEAPTGGEIKLCNLGASVLSITMPDSKGVVADIALGYSDLENMLRDTAYVGRTVGRVANRIAEGRMTINGEEYLLDMNNGMHHFNGGSKGLSSRIWESRVETNRIVMSCVSEDGDQGYPGNLTVEVVFDFDFESDHSLEITYRAVSDKDTVIDLTQSLFVNLSGGAARSIADHELKINSDRVLEVGAMLTPTGEILNVEDSAMDFRQYRRLGDGLNIDKSVDFNALRALRGYDHYFPINEWKPSILAECCTLRDVESGRTMTLLSSLPGVNVYTGNNLAMGSPISKSGERFVAYEGVSLSCHNYPNAVNKESFPSVIVKAGELYCQKIVYRFGVMK